MPDLFNDTWMRSFAQVWNDDENLTKTLMEQGFSARIGYGFSDQEIAHGLLVVDRGTVSDSGAARPGALDWDLRANLDDWRDWLQNGLGHDRFGYMIAHKRLQFKAGDPRAMLRNPATAAAFLRSFELMAKVKTQWK